MGFAQTAALVVLVQALENMEKLCGLARGGPESAIENLENSKQSYEKHVISFVKLACLFCKASARRRSIDLKFFCKVSSSTSDFLFILSLFKGLRPLPPAPLVTGCFQERQKLRFATCDLEVESQAGCCWLARMSKEKEDSRAPIEL